MFIEQYLLKSHTNYLKWAWSFRRKTSFERDPIQLLRTFCEQTSQPGQSVENISFDSKFKSKNLRNNWTLSGISLLWAFDGMFFFVFFKLHQNYFFFVRSTIQLSKPSMLFNAHYTIPPKSTEIQCMCTLDYCRELWNSL